LTTIQGNYGLVVAQQLDGDMGSISDPSNSNLSQVQTEPLSNENQTQSFFNIDNQSVMLPDPIKYNIEQNIAESTGNDETIGPQGPAGNNSVSLKENMYVKNGVQESTSEEDSFVTATASCNDSDIPLSGGFNIVGDEEGGGNGEISEIGSIPNIQNNSWTINVEGEDIQITPYVVCLTTTN